MKIPQVLRQFHSGVAWRAAPHALALAALLASLAISIALTLARWVLIAELVRVVYLAMAMRGACTATA